jgi:hypothetical protein
MMDRPYETAGSKANDNRQQLNFMAILHDSYFDFLWHSVPIFKWLFSDTVVQCCYTFLQWMNPIK